jgi:hypothetical protein
MTYISAQPLLTESWDEICYPVKPIWLTDLLPDYDIVATDRQQLVAGEWLDGRKTLFGVQSADYTIIPNSAIREVVDELLVDYRLLIKYTTTGEFTIMIILPATQSIGQERLQQSLILTNSYNGRTPFSIQGQTLTSLLEATPQLGSSLYRSVCQNGLLGWADAFSTISDYQQWLGEWAKGRAKGKGALQAAQSLPTRSGGDIRKVHHRSLTIERFQGYLRELLQAHLSSPIRLTPTVYHQLQQVALTGKQETLLRGLPIPAQLAKQARDRLRLEERLLDTSASYWLLYNAVNYALFTSRSSLTLNDRYRLDERVFHQLASQVYA